MQSQDGNTKAEPLCNRSCHFCQNFVLARDFNEEFCFCSPATAARALGVVQSEVLQKPAITRVACCVFGDFACFSEGLRTLTVVMLCLVPCCVGARRTYCRWLPCVLGAARRGRAICLQTAPSGEIYRQRTWPSYYGNGFSTSFVRARVSARAQRCMCAPSHDDPTPNPLSPNPTAPCTPRTSLLKCCREVRVDSAPRRLPTGPETLGIMASTGNGGSREGASLTPLPTHLSHLKHKSQPSRSSFKKNKTMNIPSPLAGKSHEVLQRVELTDSRRR